MRHAILPRIPARPLLSDNQKPGAADVRKIVMGLLCLSAAGLPASAQADTYPATTVLLGEVSGSVVSNQCYIVRGAGDFLRNGAANKAYVTIPEMTAAGYELNGRLALAFTSATAGTTTANYATAYPTNIQTGSFQNYSQTYNATTKALTVHFTLIYPNCTLQVYGFYASP
jgi:hypothetical protein